VGVEGITCVYSSEKVRGQLLALTDEQKANPEVRGTR
jgi:hypothetical protein